MEIKYHPVTGELFIPTHNYTTDIQGGGIMNLKPPALAGGAFTFCSMSGRHRCTRSMTMIDYQLHFK